MNAISQPQCFLNQVRPISVLVIAADSGSVPASSTSSPDRTSISSTWSRDARKTQIPKNIITVNGSETVVAALPPATSTSLPSSLWKDSLCGSDSSTNQSAKASAACASSWTTHVPAPATTIS